MTIEIGQICVRIFLDDIKKDRLILDESDFGKLLAHNVDFVLPLGYNAEGKYRCWVYSNKLQRIISEDMGAEVLCELNPELRNYLKTLGINASNIEEILRFAK